jgi:hypothetical protein
MDEESKKMADFESVHTGQGVSLVGKESSFRPFNEENKLDQEKTQETGQLDSNSNNNEVDEDLRDIIQSFKKHKDKLADLLRDGQKLVVEDLIVFKDKADDVIGYELDEFANYLSTRHSIGKTKYWLKWEEILAALQNWAVELTQNRKREKIEDWIDDNSEYANPPAFDSGAINEEDEIEVERFKQRERSKDLLLRKIESYSDKIKDIFKSNRDQENSDEDSDEENHLDFQPQVRINRLSKVLKDLGSLIGIVFWSWDDYISGTVDEKKTRKDIVERIKKFMWKEVHHGICQNTAASKGRKNGDGILRNALTKKDKRDDEITVKETEKENDDTEKDNDEIEENDDKSNKEGNKTQNNDETQKDNESEASPTHRPDTSKSKTDSEISATTKKTKTEMEITTQMRASKTSNLDEKSNFGQKIDKNLDRTILFEDEAFLFEHKVNHIKADLFINLLKIFLDENEDMILHDHLHEFDEQIEETFSVAHLKTSFGAPTDAQFDPFKQRLEKTLEQYENSLIKGDFKDEKEREVTLQIVRDLKYQIAKIEETRNQTRDSERESKKQPLTLEELRQRGLRELFEFYAKQHLPEGLEFGDILDKKEVIDLGEFSIFARDFKIKLPKKKLIEIFKKTSDFHHTPLNFNQFWEAIDKIGHEINQERIRGIKKKLRDLEKAESVSEIKKESSSKSVDTSKQNEKDEEKILKKTNKSDAEGDDEKDEDKKSEKSQKSDNSEAKEQEDNNSEKEEKSEKSGNEESDEESKSKATKTNLKSETRESKTRSVKFGEESDKSGDSEEESEEETDPIKIEKNNLNKDLKKYLEYTEEQTHNEIMDFLEVHDHQKYRLRAKGVHVIPFFMKGKYSQQRKASSQQGISQGSEIRISKNSSNVKEIKKKMIYEKEKLERIKQFKLKTRNQQIDKSQKGVFNTMSPSQMDNKLLNANLLQQTKTKVGVKLKEERPNQRVTLEGLQQMHLKDLTQRRFDDLRLKDIVAEDDNLEFESSAFEYFFPDNKKKGKGKKTTANKFNIK